MFNFPMLHVHELNNLFYWQASHSSPLRMASMEQAVFSAAENSFLAAAAAVWVAMTPR